MKSARRTSGSSPKGRGRSRPAPRTNEELTARTRKLLVRAGRELFGKSGFGAVSTEALGERARLTRPNVAVLKFWTYWGAALLCR